MSGTRSTTRPAHTNRLVDATSPYLLQHAHNPVDWYPWGEEALQAARQQDKPIFLSIGYAACHWCHVMEHESFENDEIASMLNEHFISIKVDREERPDLDNIYMMATMLYNQGQGGWPMSVFLTPDQRPFYAGTYFPPTSRYGRPGFKELLETIAKLWNEDREKITQSATALSEAVIQYSQAGNAGDRLTLDVVAQAADALEHAFDAHTGGILSGPTNKFPPSMAMSLMLREYDRSRRDGEPEKRLLERVELTLDHMSRGGIYDHLGGGIARYSTDPQWLVPHFEKMLYDQALVSDVYLEAYQVTEETRWAEVTRDIFEYVLRDLQSPEGGFYSSRDADSEGVEGKYYVWSKSEVMEVLGEQAGEWFCGHYDVTDSGNWEGHNILNVQRSMDTVARLHDIGVDKLKKSLADSREKLLAVREKRVAPGLDDKVLTSWNGLMIASLAKGGRVLNEAKYTEAARTAAEFILSRLTRDGRLLRAYRDGKAHTGGYLDDYAFFVEGLLELYETTLEPRWFNEAVRLTDTMAEHFWDESAGGFFFSADDAEELIVRGKEYRDGAIPSGNSVAVMNLLRLALMLDRDDLRDKAERTMQAIAGDVRESPLAFERLLAAVAFARSETREVVIFGPKDDPATRALIAEIDTVYDPHRVVVLIEPEPSPEAESGPLARSPLTQGKKLIDGKPAAYVCRNYACRQPVTGPAELRQQLK